ncbi:SUR7-domain-containing protein [Sporormia fimetaria CBS 119925]|uniref:SUR7-domain-containing protein n=1 Tax=Sporormia fimetaria CBS 119925 TaxID=1340428 RepID=A0A6A6VA95_9PLEO|nr:SUR7-domain-containing protein [Sporormia fimetaria CBS 119925]
MGLIRPIIAASSLILLAGGILLQFLTILSGGVHSRPENQFYFLEASDIGNIPGARNPSRWTFWSICGVNSRGHNADCGSPVPALPFDPPRNFGTQQNVPQQFIGTSHYYYMSRFMFAFYIIALFFAVIALFTGLLALCSRLGGYLSGLTTAVALFFQTITAALMTAWTVEGRNHFRDNGQSAKLGVKSYAFTWTAMACFLLSSILFCLSGRLGKDRTHTGRGGGFLGRNRSMRSHRSTNRGSFFDTESQRKSKDSYS